MPDASRGLTREQARAAEHRGGPLLLLGPAGSGKTATLVARFAHLVEVRGVAPESVLLVCLGGPQADATRTDVELALGDRPFEELPVLGVHDACARILHDEALEAGLDPFTVTATHADRLAMLLDRLDELTLRAHDFRGSPAAMLGGVLARIDRLKEEGITAADVGRWAAALPDDDPRAVREREFAALHAAHDAMLAQAGALDLGDLVLRTEALLRGRPHVRARVAARWRHVLVDELQDLTPAQCRVVALLAAEHGDLLAAADPDQAVLRPQGAPRSNLRTLADRFGGLEELRLPGSLRCPPAVARAAATVVAGPDAVDGGGPPQDASAVAFWRCANERAQAQAVAAQVERLVRDGADPARIGVLVRSVRHEGRAVAVALDERAVPHRLVGAAALFAQAEVRDVLAWLRLLGDPNDAGAAVRALARPPVELRSADIARCVQIARRRKLDMVSALAAATESPQIDPAARERILGFLKLHRSFAAGLDTERPDLFVHRLVDRLGLRRRQLFAAQADVVERLVALAKLGELAERYARRDPQATPRDLGRWLAAVAEAGGHEDEEGTEDGVRAQAVQVLSMGAAKGRELDHVFVLGLQASRMPGARRRLVEPVPDELLSAEAREAGTHGAHVAAMRRLLHVAMTRARRTLTLTYAERSDSGAPQPPSPFCEEARGALGLAWEAREEELFGPDEALHATFGRLRDELLGSVRSVGARLGELRLDTDLDVAHGVTRYLELLKLSALMARPDGQSVADALPGINAAILQAATATQREVLQTSPLDELLLASEQDAAVRAAAVAAREEPSLEPFLPRRGDGLALSASDIDTYRTCPLKYKFARVFRIPQEPTTNQRFGIVVHQVLERYHQSGGRTVDELLGLLDAAWRRGGFTGGSDEEVQLRVKADDALRRYHQRSLADDGEPLWFEKAFQFKLGPHVLRGRVDRVDRLPDGSYELIDYKTGRPRTKAALREDVQLALYAVAAREAWDIERSVQSYLYVLDDEKVPLPADEVDQDWITDTVLEVADGILGQGFEPTPSYAACSMCDFRIACPAAER
ncbi:ATP-dependent DNA helicase [Conexibacter sp. SYSU D00693]|uniref:ATP-dependent helicase n=1 Tax=Conexibacter sp. SYSU D00693 TaxID=2812560 RepID=UPI00196AC4C2|nr:ATP-dependent DNA helicase [Conexibacter sp. SYSU D00693]